LKHGAAFVCLNTTPHSDEWNKNICDKLNIKWIFVDKVPQESYKCIAASAIFLSDTIFLVKDERYSQTEIATSTEQKKIAYACQTSGTTGIPKIVQVPHASIVPNITYLRYICIE
jgi:long-subunit acyl-CoA synthetase (AMP-forming)